MITHRFVQLSDIHFGQERDGSLVIHEDVRDQLLSDVARLAEVRGPANLVVVAGDIAFAGKDAEYKRASEWLDLLTKAAKCRETDVRVVPGNHDCDRSQLNRLARTVHRNIREGTSKSAYADLEDYAKGAVEANPLLPKLRAYCDFASVYGSDFTSIARPLWTRDFPIAAGITLRLVGMNSVQVCDDDDRAGNMILGNTQYVLPDKPDVVYVAIMHHPLDWYMDKADAKQYLHSRVKVIMVGHEHIADITKSSDAQRNEWLEIYSGATNPPDSSTLYRHTYNWLEISLCEKAGAHVLTMNVFPRIWAPRQTRFVADTERLAGKESAEFDIACPALKAKATAASRDAIDPPAVAAAFSLLGSPHPADHPVTAATTMATYDDAAVAKLKFLFWRYLDWQQRIKVLVQADALPPSADRPVPQTLERLALEYAQKQGKLAAVWDAIMEYVPDAKKQANPFTTTKN